jgi:hypothetical protein
LLVGGRTAISNQQLAISDAKLAIYAQRPGCATEISLALFSVWQVARGDCAHLARFISRLVSDEYGEYSKNEGLTGKTAASRQQPAASENNGGDSL